MTQVTAKLKYLRIAPRKVRMVIEQIRGKSTAEAETILNFMIKKGSVPILKLLKQAVANAKNNFQLDSANLFISKIMVDEGPKLKRWRARARGSAAEIQRKVSHITIVLDQLGKKQKKIKALAKTEKIENIRQPAEKKAEKPKFKPEKEEAKPKLEKVTRRFFQRKVF